ncbi:hypothetical protein LAC02_51260 [Ligilactobacillus acidipiscis]|nr:hypothetical protein LAC02_51260 [Ligilactobacillus acidipiscis]
MFRNQLFTLRYSSFHKRIDRNYKVSGKVSNHPKEAAQDAHDLDSVQADTFGQQVGSDFNTHYQTDGLPLVILDCFLGSKIRSGNE